MRLTVLILMCAALVTACPKEDSSTSGTDTSNAGDGGDGGVAPDTGSTPGTTRVYATIVTHNEQDTNPGCGPVLADEALFDANRALTVALAHAIVDAGGAWDMQSDYRWIEQLEVWESDEDRQATDGTNILAWLATAFPGQIVVDAHNHESLNNYADVAKRLAELDVPDSGVVGGLLWYPVESEDWTRFWQPLAGKAYPEFTWSPSILWGAGTANHQGPDSEASGVWRPKAADAYHEDDPGRSLAAVGTYRNIKYEMGHGEGLAELIAQVRNGEHPDGVMLTAAIFMDQCTQTQEEIDELAAFIASHQQDVDDGVLVWATLPDIVSTWKTEYGGQAYVVNAPVLDDPTTGVCPDCSPGQVCCEAPAPCAGTCVAHCEANPESCPAGTTCLESGLCG